MKDLILLAKGNTKTQCPFDGAEVWGVNDVGSSPEFKGKHIDRIFTFDPRNPEFVKEAKNIAPIWSWRDYADVKYPLDEVIKHFGCSYFTNTISYMLALAIYEGFNRIRMYGVDAPYGGIYFMEKAGLEYWIGRAQQAGIEITTAQGSDILRTHDGLLYGQRGECSIQMYLSERMHIMNMLPREGHYDDVYLANLVRWLVAIKVKEKEFHKIQLGSSPNGQISYQCDHEFQSTVHFPWWALCYVRDCLRQQEQAGKLPVFAISLYDKLMKFNQPETVGDIKNEIRISYVLATKNRGNLLSKVLENTKKFLTPQDELIVVDGNSTDNTKQVLEQYKSIITKVISGEDKNAAHALNKGYLESKGKYVKQLPDDDIIFPGEMERAVKYLDEHPEIDLLVCGGIKRTPTGEQIVNAPENYGHLVKDVFDYGACGAGFVHRRESFARYGILNTDYVNIDREIACRIIAQGGVVRFFPGRHYYHATYVHSTSIQNLDKWNADNKKLIEKYCKEESKCLV